MGTVAAQPQCPLTPGCDEASLVEIVERAMHSSVSEWLFLRELRVGTGRQNGAAQRLDAFALNTFPHMPLWSALPRFRPSVDLWRRATRPSRNGRTSSAVTRGSSITILKLGHI